MRNPFSHAIAQGPQARPPGIALVVRSDSVFLPGPAAKSLFVLIFQDPRRKGTKGKPRVERTASPGAKCGKLNCIKARMHKNLAFNPLSWRVSRVLFITPKMVAENPRYDLAQDERRRPRPIPCACMHSAFSTRLAGAGWVVFSGSHYSSVPWG